MMNPKSNQIGITSKWIYFLSNKYFMVFIFNKPSMYTIALSYTFSEIFLAVLKRIRVSNYKETLKTLENWG